MAAPLTFRRKPLDTPARERQRCSLPPPRSHVVLGVASGASGRKASRIPWTGAPDDRTRTRSTVMAKIGESKAETAGKTAETAGKTADAKGDGRFAQFEAVPGQAPRFMRPEVLVIIGRDTRHERGEHALWDLRALLNADGVEVAGIQAAAEARRIPAVPVTFQTIAADKIMPEYIAGLEKLCGVLDSVSYPAYHAILLEIRAGKSVNVPVVVDGRQRVISGRAANEAALKAGAASGVFIPTVLMAGLDKSGQVAAMIAANTFAKPLEAWEKADMLADFHKHNGKDRTAAAAAFNCTTEAVRLMEKWLNLDDGVRQQVREGKMAYSVAITLSDKAPEVQAAAAATAAAGGSARETNAAVRESSGTGAKRPSPKRLGLLIKAFRAKDGVPADVRERLAKANPAILIEFALGQRDASKVCAGFEAVWSAVGEKKDKGSAKKS